MKSISIPRLGVPTVYAHGWSRPIVFYTFTVVFVAATLAGSILATVITDASQHMPMGGGGQAGPPSLDQILWMGLGSNYAVMTQWSMVGSACVAIVTTKILRDTVKYYDYYGYHAQPKVAIGIGIGTTLAVAHLLLTCVQTFKLCESAFAAYHTVYRLDVLANTTSDLIGGLFNFSAALYYTSQVFRLSGRKVWLFALVMFLNTGTFILTLIVAVTGYKVPEPDMMTLAKLKDFNEFRVPFFKAWGVVALLGDAAICGSLLYYLFKTKDSILHREKTLYHKFKALVLETMLPPVIGTFILVIGLEKRTATIGDYRRAVKYLLPPFYYLSLLHSLVGRINIRQHLAETADDDGSDNKDSIPLNSTSSHNPKSTIHIDPKRGKEVVVVEDHPISPAQEEIPCKRTFGATESIPNVEYRQERPPMADRKSSWPRPSKHDVVKVKNPDDVPSKMTFGATDSIADLSTNSFPLEDAGPSTPVRRDSPARPPPPSSPTQEFPSWADPYYFGTLGGRGSGWSKK